MEMKLDANDALQIIIHMLADNLATTRKLGDIIIASLYQNNPEAGVAAMSVFHQESQSAMRELLSKIWANYGKIDLDDLLGPPASSD